MGKVHRKGTAVVARQAGKRHRRNCRSAPKVPTNLSVVFRRREMGKRDRWRAFVNWDPVDEDVAGRALTPERYEVQLRATDASGDSVETALQEEARTAQGEDFTVHSGSCPVHTTNPKQRNARELNAAGDVIKKTLTGITTGISTQVNFYAMEDTDGADPRIKFEIWNVTDGSSVATKNETLSGIYPKLYVTRSFMPAIGQTYEARVSWVSGSGVGLFHHVQWHAQGEAAVWRQWTSADEEPTETTFVPLARPKTWYYSARVRVMNRVAGNRCYSAWSAWTTPKNPGHNLKAGPPAPSGLVQKIDKVEGVRRAAWRVRARWNELPWWIPPDGEAQEGADRYVVQLAVSSQSDGTPQLNVRTVSIPADDADVGVVAKKDWVYRILGKRYYRSRVAAVSDGRRGAFTAWTAWASPGGVPDPPTGLTWSNPNRSVLLAKWNEPADPTDVDRYRVRVFRQPGAVLVEEAYTPATRFLYHIPKADRDNNHFVRVASIEDPGTLDEDDTPVGWDTGAESSAVDSSDLADTAPVIADIHNENDDPVLRKTGFPRMKVRYTAAGNIVDATNEGVEFGTEDVDTDGFHTVTAVDNIQSTLNADMRHTLPFDGQYLVLYSGTFAGDAVGRRELILHKNAPQYERISQLAVSGGAVTGMSASTMVDGVVGDYVLLKVFQNSGGLLALNEARLTIVYMGIA